MSPRAVSPRVVGLEEAEVMLARDQHEYLETPALPVVFQDGSQGILTRWRFSAEELELLRAGADLFLLTLTYGQPFQPVQLTAGYPDWAVNAAPDPVDLEAPSAAEDARVRANIARRKAEQQAALDQVKPPGGLPLLEALTGADLLLLSTAQLEELSRDYVRRRNEELGAELVAAVDGVLVGGRGGGLDVRVRWRNLEDRGSPWPQGPDGTTYPVVHEAVGPRRARCGAGAGAAGPEDVDVDLVPTDREVTCLRCTTPRRPDSSRS